MLSGGCPIGWAHSAVGQGALSSEVSALSLLIIKGTGSLLVMLNLLPLTTSGILHPSPLKVLTAE